MYLQNKWIILFKNVEPCYIINIDETSWEVIQVILKCWHVKGKDHVLRYVNSNRKERITVVAGVRANGLRLPLQFIATGKTERVLDTQIGDVNYHFKNYSENGWTTKETFKDYIIGIRNYYNFRYRANPHAQMKKIGAVQDRICAWEKLDIETIRESFAQLKILE